MGEKKFEIIRRRPVKLDSNEKEAIRAEVARLLKEILKTLLDQPDKACVSVEQGDRTTIFAIDVVQADFGRLLGSRGRNIEALRVLVNSLCGKHDIRGIIQVKNEDRFF